MWIAWLKGDFSGQKTLVTGVPHIMATTVHATAVVDPQATIGHGVTIGPFAVVEAGTAVGDHCQLASRVVIKEGTTLGNENTVEEGAVLGGKPQHLAHNSRVGQLRIGCRNTIRENVTLHRALAVTDATVVGDDNLIMVNAHVAHDCQLGNHTILTNNVMLAGHVLVADYAYLSGGVGVHQFCRIGMHAMVGGQAHLKKDVPPFVTVDGQSTRVVGLNVIGLKRRGFSRDELRQLKDAYRIIYRQGLTWGEVLEVLERTFESGPAAEFHRFLAGGRRGFLLERRTPAGATVPFPRLATDTAPSARRRAS